MAVRLKSINAERLSENIPPQINFQTQLALPSEEPGFRENMIILPYTFTITAVPPVVSMTLRGIVVVQGTEEEIAKLRDEIKARRIPLPVMQSVFHHSLAEAVLVFRDLGVPPPIPLPQMQPGKQGGRGTGPVTAM